MIYNQPGLSKFLRSCRFPSVTITSRFSPPEIITLHELSSLSANRKNINKKYMFLYSPLIILQRLLNTSFSICATNLLLKRVTPNRWANYPFDLSARKRRYSTCHIFFREKDIFF